MLSKEIMDILSASQETGWVLEPEAKRLLASSGLKTSQFAWTRELEDALKFSHKIGYPVVAKVVSPKVMHKSDVGGVVLDIQDADALTKTFEKFSRIEGFSGVLVEEMVSGLELIIGAKIDYQFGPVVLLGIGGTGVEIYQDIVIRMAPLDSQDVQSMIHMLKGKSLLQGYRGSAPINLDDLGNLLISFSMLVMDLKDSIVSIDLNPVMCTPEQCLITDARIIL